MSFYRFIVNMISIYVNAAYKVTTIFEDPIPKVRGLIVAANHQSNMDPVILACSIPRQICYMAKEELFTKPFLGKLLLKLGTFKVSRGVGDMSALDHAIHLVESDNILGIFPEGTRSKDGELRRAKSGIVVVASQSGGDIVPVGITYGKRRFIRKTVTVRFGHIIKNERFQLTDHNRKEMRAAGAVIMDSIGELIAKDRGMPND